MKRCFTNIIDRFVKKDIKFVQKKRIFFIVPLVVLLVALIAGLIFGLTNGNPFNAGMQYTGGYVIVVRTGETVSDSRYSEYSQKLENAVKDYTYEYDTDVNYPVVFDKITKECDGDETIVKIYYKADKALPNKTQDKIMEELNEDLVSTLNQVVGAWTPVAVTISGGLATVKYDSPIKSLFDDGSLKATLESAGLTVSNLTLVQNDISNTVSFNFGSSLSGKSDSEAVAFVKDAATLNMYYSARASVGEMVGSGVKMNLIAYAILGVAIMLVLVWLYMLLRFDMAAAFTVAVSLLHDMIVMLCLVVIFHIRLDSTMIGVLLVMCAFAMVNLLSTFNRIRENRNELYAAGNAATAGFVANKSANDNLRRNAFITVAVAVVLGFVAVVCAIAGVSDLAMFVLPVMVGMFGSLYSSICIAPALWATLRRGDAGAPRRKLGLKNKAAADTNTNN